MSDHETRYPDPGAVSGRRVEQLVDALISLAGMAFLVWLAVAWAGRTFGAPAAAALFPGFLSCAGRRLPPALRVVSPPPAGAGTLSAGARRAVPRIAPARCPAKALPARIRRFCRTLSCARNA